MGRIKRYCQYLFWRTIRSARCQALAIGAVLYNTGSEPFAPVGSYLIVGTCVYIALLGFGDLFGVALALNDEE
jgi:hypothetical protein